MTEITVVNDRGASGNAGNAIVDIEFGSVTEFKKRMMDMKQKLNFMEVFFKEVMVKDEDFGTIPGTGKPTLYKPGAEKLLELYGFAALIKSREEEKNYDDGYYRAILTVQLVHRATGTIIGEGVGECSSYESKYRYRWVYENKIPNHIAKEDLLFEEKDEWKNNVKTGNTYKMFRIPNDDLFSQWNTVLKMAHKRALTGVTLQCTRSSGIFMQEEAEMDEYAGVPEEDRKKARGAQGRVASANNGRAIGASAGGQSSGSATQKNRVLAIMKKQGLDWNRLAEEATFALGHEVKKVITDIKTEDEWRKVAEHLEMFADVNGSLDDIPEELRGS